MNHSKLIDELLNELSYRVGIVDLKNKNHQSIISEILSEWGEYDAKQIIMEFLTNEDDAKQNGTKEKFDGYTHIGAGVYVDDSDVDNDGKAKKGAQKYKSDGKTLTAMSDDEYQKTKSAQGKEGEKVAADTPQNQQGGGNEKSPDDIEKEKGVEKTVGSSSDYAKREKERVDKVNGTKSKGVETKEKDDIELSKKDASKVLKQILMTKAEAKKQQKGVGLGTPESRTGESVTVYAGQKIQELMNSGKSYEDSRAELEKELLEISKNSKSVLTKEWVQSGLAVFDHLNNVYGFENIKHFAWDTPEGNVLVNATGHGTSADMFVQLANGETVGVSLKKDFKVFIVNGGYGKAMKEFQQKTGVSLPDNCQAKHYTDRRDVEFNKSVEIVNGDSGFFEEQAKLVLENEDEFNKTFGPKKDAIRSRKSYIVSKKLGISVDQAKKMSDDEIDSVVKNTSPQELVSFLKEINNADDMKFAASFYKRKEIESKHGIYGKLRKLDNEMTENIYNAFDSNESMREKTKEKIIEDTHIIDTLFPEKPLDDFKTVFGTDPAVEMTRESIQKIFGISDLYSQYKNAETDEEKAKLREQIENQIKEKLTITKKRNIPVIAILIKNEDGTTSELPLYTIGVRTRGIGNAQTLEVSQAVFGSLALKNGNTDVNSWDDKDKKTVVDGEVGDILSSFEDDTNPDLSELSMEEQQEIIDRIELLDSYGSKSKKLNDLKKRLNI